MDALLICLNQFNVLFVSLLLFIGTNTGGIDRTLSTAYRFRYVHIDGAKGVDHVRTVLVSILNRHDQQTCSSDCRNEGTRPRGFLLAVVAC